MVKLQGMKAFVKNIEAAFVVFILLLTFASTQKVQAACQVVSCNPIFASNVTLTSPVTSLQQKSLSSFTPTDLYVGYEVGACTGTARISYCSDVWRGFPPLNLCNAAKVDATGFLLTNVGSKQYLVSKIPGSDFNDSYAAYPMAGIPKLNAIQTNIWDGSNWACASDAKIAVKYLSEACSATPLATRATDGTYSVSVAVDGSQLIPEKAYKLIFTSRNSLEINPVVQADVFTVTDGAQSNIQRRFQGIRVDAGTYNVCVVPNDSNDIVACASAKCIHDIALDQTTKEEPSTFPDPEPVVGQTPAFQLCNQAAPEDRDSCRACINGSNDLKNPETEGLWTAFGCVKTSKEGIVVSFIRIGLGISGGFVLLSILYGAFLITTSSGDIKRVQEGQEMVTSAVMGLLFVIFSIIILRFIGVSLLQIPGFGT